MTTKTLNEQAVIHEAMTVLLEHLKQLFAGESVESLAGKIGAFQEAEQLTERDS